MPVHQTAVLRAVHSHKQPAFSYRGLWQLNEASTTCVCEGTPYLQVLSAFAEHAIAYTNLHHEATCSRFKRSALTFGALSLLVYRVLLDFSHS